MRSFWIACLVVALFYIPASAIEPPPVEMRADCGFRPDVLKHLAIKYWEQPRARGITNTGGLVEVLHTDDRTTWTIIVTLPRVSPRAVSISCLVAAGEEWALLYPGPLLGEEL